MAVIDIIVGGRFHSEKLFHALSAKGHDVNLITPFPKSKFPHLNPKNIKSVLLPELLYRLLRKTISENFADELKMSLFGKEAANAVRSEADIVIGWSSFSLEAFEKSKAKKLLIRDSSHIQTQMEILKKEYALRGKIFHEKKKGVERELKEYALCDKLIVLSEFAKNSFLQHGYPENKIEKLTLGTDLSLFKPDNHVSKLPLRVVYFGTLSYIKGLPYLLEAFKKIPASQATLELIGPFTPEISASDIPQNVKYFAPMKHPELAKQLCTYDIFVFPTLEDGFGQTLLQAMASGLLPITTENCGAAEILEKGKNGVILPIASSESIYEAIKRLATDMNLFTQMKTNVTSAISSHTWENYSLQVIEIVNKHLKASSPLDKNSSNGKD